jgi:hypothetical protein
MKTNKILFGILFIIGIFLLIYLIKTNIDFQSKLIEINTKSEVNLKITRAYNERGTFILNNKYYLNSSSIIVSNKNNLAIEDKAIWKPKITTSNFVIADISAPFNLKKKKNCDTQMLVKQNDTIIIMLIKGG